MGNTQGLDGENGRDGKDGKDGRDGAIGPRGETGPKGDMGPKGDSGGLKGDKGDKGDDGYITGLLSFEKELYANAMGCDSNQVCSPPSKYMKKLKVNDRDILAELDAIKIRLDTGDIVVSKTNDNKYARVVANSNKDFKLEVYNMPQGGSWQYSSNYVNANGSRLP